MDPIQPTKKSSNFLGIIKLVFFEICFVALCLTAIFGTLNFFNILKLENLSHFFSFLPHKEVSREITTTVDSTQNARDLLFSYLSKNLSKDSIPIKSSLSLPLSKFNNEYQANWSLNDGPLSAIFAYAKNTTTPEFEYIMIGPLNSPTSTLYEASSTTSAQIIGKYFLTRNIPFKWTCFGQKKSSVWQCKYTRQLDNGKTFYEVISTPFGTKESQIAVTTCFFPTGSKLENSSSCFSALKNL